MKKVIIGVCAVVIILSASMAKAISVTPESLYGPLEPVWRAIDNLQKQIKDIRLTPGPQGEVGPIGPQGPQGEPGNLAHVTSTHAFFNYFQPTENGEIWSEPFDASEYQDMTIYFNKTGTAGQKNIVIYASIDGITYGSIENDVINGALRYFVLPNGINARYYIFAIQNADVLDTYYAAAYLQSN